MIYCTSAHPQSQVLSHLRHLDFDPFTSFSLPQHYHRPKNSGLGAKGPGPITFYSKSHELPNAPFHNTEVFTPCPQHTMNSSKPFWWPSLFAVNSQSAAHLVERPAPSWAPKRPVSLSSFIFLILIFYCYSITVVWLFSPSLHPTPAKPPSFPHFHPPPWFCPFIVVPVTP